jgi:hypothetical protein
MLLDALRNNAPIDYLLTIALILVVAVNIYSIVIGISSL